MTRHQPAFAFPGRVFRDPIKGLIQAPDNYPTVSDSIDPLTGPVEVPPCPPLDERGSRYWVGVERHLWRWELDGMHVPDERELLVDMRAILDEMRRRGARIAFEPAHPWGPARGRRDYRSPLRDLMTIHEAPRGEERG